MEQPELVMKFLTVLGAPLNLGLCFDISWPFASHDSNPYPNRSRIAQYNAIKLLRSCPVPFFRGVALPRDRFQQTTCLDVCCGGNYYQN